MYGSSAPPPPPLMNGSIPSRRLATQPQPEMPSCVQNAMMTKDKKPFTYTPGGIDLSQIKSPRMAQRISRNANLEGVGNNPKPCPFAQQNNSSIPQASQASAFGMPVQVFPSGPPPPPPAPSKQQLSVSNANRSPSLPRKTNQSFEPPPMGCRPEIKIPPNPMAALRKVPTPKEKNDFWVEEYKKERSKSPMPGQDDAQNAQNASSNGNEGSVQSPQSVHDFSNYSATNPSTDKVDSPVTPNPPSNTYNQTKVDSPIADQNNNFNHYPANNNLVANNSVNNHFNNNYANKNSNANSPQQRINSPFTASPQPNLPKPLSPVKLPQDENVPIYVRSSQRAVSEKPQAPQPPVSSLARQSSLEQAQPPIYTRSPRNVNASPVQNQFNQPQTENVPIYVRSFQKGQAPQPPKPAEQNVQKPLSTAQQTFNNDPGRQYYQPNRVTSPPASNEQQQAPSVNQPLPPWMTRRANTKEIPEWASNVDNFATNNNRSAMPQNNSFQQANPTNQNSYPTNGNNMNNGTGMKERIVPIQFDQSPTKNVSSPTFTAQPYQNTPTQYNRVQPPPFAPTASNYASTYNDPNKFVDQGYNNVPNWDNNQQPNRVMSPNNYANQGNKSNDGSRVIPIQLEDGHPYLNGPISQTPHVIQSDARSTPNQSKSFRVLQQITDTMKMDPTETAALSKPAELQQPQYSRPLGPNDMNEHQLRKMKLNDFDRNQDPARSTFESRFAQQFPDWVPSKPSYNVIQSMTKSDRDADVQVLGTEYKNETFNSFEHLNQSYSDIPYTVSMPDTPMQSDCESICTVEPVTLRDDDIYEAHMYESYYNDTPSSRRGSGFSDATMLPRIVITPTPEDDAMYRRSSLTTSEKIYEDEEPFEESTKNQLNRNTTEMNIARDDKAFIGDAQKITNSSSTDSSVIENNSSDKLDENKSSETEKLDHDSESESSETESEESDQNEKKEPLERKRSDILVAVKSVANVRVYDSEDEVESIQDMEEPNRNDVDYNHENVSSDDESADIIEFIIDHGPESEAASLHCDDYLSVIYEEDDDHPHSRRVKLDSICSSNSSATLANDDRSERKDFDSDDEDDSDTVGSDHDSADGESDNESTSVTVRLPLRLSFSRSENDEEITTVEIGKSEIEVEDNSNHSSGLVESESDVSVSFSLRQPRSNPRSRPISLDVPSFDDDDSEVSVSVSLPRRNRTLSPVPFVRQRTLSPVPHSADAFEYKPWNFGSSIEEKPEQEANDVEKECEERIFSVRDHIAVFESVQNHREEFQRQNACESSSSNEEQEDEVVVDDQYREDSPKYQPNEDTNYDSFVSVTYQPIEQIHRSATPEPDVTTEETEEIDQANLSVRDKIAAFEQPASSQYKLIDARREIYAARQASQTDEVPVEIIQPEYTRSESIRSTNSPCVVTPQGQQREITLQPFKSFERNSSMQRSIQDESELDEDDSGVMTDLNRRISEQETDTESECFPELRKLTRYERAATHSRLFKFLQEYESETENSDKSKVDEDLAMFSRPKKIIHNVSITRKQNPDLIKSAETMAERRERLSLTCASPTSSVNEKLIDELVQSALNQAKRRNMRNIPIEKIQAAARKALQQQDENDSCDTTYSSFDSTPALTPQEFNDENYDSETGLDILPSKAFKNLQEQSLYGRKRKLWAARCPRVLSSKTVNSDLSRVTETRESQTPERDQQQHVAYF